jgi:hypothetical protein
MYVYVCMYVCMCVFICINQGVFNQYSGCGLVNDLCGSFIGG